MNEISYHILYHFSNVTDQQGKMTYESKNFTQRW